MPPASRRQKKYEQNLRKVQSRNLVAGIILLLAVGGSIFLIRQLIIGNKPTIHVSINRVNHSGTRMIPFSVGSCDIVKQAFEKNLDCKTEDVQELDAQKSELEMVASGIAPRDIQIVYLNGHLSDAKSRPSVLANSGSNRKSDDGESPDDEVYWIGPESDAVENKLSALIDEVNSSDAKIKLLLLDAGRYSWSPTFPGRETNGFQSVLAQKMASNAWNLSGEFWIITSHSDGEISNVSTPLQGSLFAVAIAESLNAIALEKPTELHVQTLFNEIKKRTTSYSRNFEDRALQNPVLMKAGVGIVEGKPGIEEPPMIVTWKKSGEPPTDSAGPSYQWREFGRNASVFSQWLFEPTQYSALPKQSMEKLEMFLEQGLETTNWSSSDQRSLDDYTDQLTQFRMSPAEPTDFDIKTVNLKLDQVSRFRRALQELSVLTRFRNQIRLWDDNAFKETGLSATDLVSPIRLDDDQLIEPKSIPLIERWPARLQTLMAANKILIETVQRRLERQQDDPLTPMQAELLGVLSQRYLPLIDAFQSNSTRSKEVAEKTDPLPESYTIDLEAKEKSDRYNPTIADDKSDPSAGIKYVVNLGNEEVSAFFRTAEGPPSDTSYRYSLAANGSEFSKLEPVVVPKIKWVRTEKQIAIASQSKESEFKIPLFERKEIPFELNTSAVDAVELRIKQPSSAGLQGLRFGFNSEFIQKLNITELDPTDQPFRKTKTFEVFFHYVDPDPTMVGQRFEFEISATDGKAAEESSIPLKFKILITKDAEYRIVSKRELANRNGDQSSARLYRWGTPPAESESEWNPLLIKTLANVNSPFKFNLTNNSESPETFTARLFKIKQFPVGIKTELLSSDRDDVGQIRDFIRELSKQSKTAGVPPLQQKDLFELIGEAKVGLPDASRSADIQFLPPPSDPAAAPAANPDAFVKIEHGVIVAFYSDAELDTDSNPNPDWYQLLIFEPREPANAAALKQNRLKVKPGIVDNFGPIEIKKLGDSLAPTVDQKQAARLTIVSENALRQNRFIVDTLSLEELLSGNGAELSHDNSDAFLLLDALGIPNYMTYETNEGTMSDTGFRRQLTGIRISKKPDNWSVSPQTWSFASDNPPGSPFQWLAKKSQDIQNIYVKIGENQDGAGRGEGNDRGVGEVELFLPFKKDDVLLRGQDDFVVRWKNNPLPKRYPNERQHFIAISEFGLNAWSEVKSHTISISAISGRTLQILRKGADQPLGQWRFVTNSPGNKPKLTATQMTFENTDDQVRSTLITLDIRGIQPAIEPDAIQLSLNNQPLPKPKLKSFLESSEEGRGRYEFSFFELRTAFEKGLTDPMNRNTVIEASATDFFDETYSDALRLTITERKPEIPKPKPTTLEISFSNIGEAPVDLMKFSSVQINGSSIPLDQATPFNGGTIRVESVTESPSLRITGIFPGNYSIQVDGLIRRETTAAQYTSATATEDRISVPQEGAKTILTFK